MIEGCKKRLLAQIVVLVYAREVNEEKEFGCYSSRGVSENEFADPYPSPLLFSKGTETQARNPYPSLADLLGA